MMFEDNRGHEPSKAPATALFGQSPLLGEWLGIGTDQLSARDSAAVLQMLFNFSAAFAKLRTNGLKPIVLETGSGLSTQVFKTLLSRETGGKLISVDYAASEAMHRNSRNLLDLNDVREEARVEVVSKPTIDIHQLEAVYGGSKPASWRPSGLNATELEPFVDLRLDDRRRAQVEDATKRPFGIDSIYSDLTRGSLQDSEILSSYRLASDEFEVLRTAKPKGVLPELLRKKQPNLVFLDSGEFSTLPEYLIADDLLGVGTLVLVQDIIFPKSVKGFIISALMAASSKWEILWVDKSTPQGMIAAVKTRAEGR